MKRKRRQEEVFQKEKNVKRRKLNIPDLIQYKTHHEIKNCFLDAKASKIYVVTKDGELYIWVFDRAPNHWKFTEDAAVTTNKDGTLLANLGKGITVYEKECCVLENESLFKTNSKITCFCRTDRFIVCGCKNGKLYVYDLTKRRLLIVDRVFVTMNYFDLRDTTSYSPLSSVGFNKNGSLLFVGSKNGEVTVFNVTSSKPVKSNILRFKSLAIQFLTCSATRTRNFFFSVGKTDVVELKYSNDTIKSIVVPKLTSISHAVHSKPNWLVCNVEDKGTLLFYSVIHKRVLHELQLEKNIKVSVLSSFVGTHDDITRLYLCCFSKKK